MTLWVAGHTGAVPTLHASDPQYWKSLTRNIMPIITQLQSLSSLPVMPVHTSKSQRVESMSLFCSHAWRHFYTGRFWRKYIMWNGNSYYMDTNLEWNFRFSWWWLWRITASVIWRRVVWYIGTKDFQVLTVITKNAFRYLMPCSLVDRYEVTE